MPSPLVPTPGAPDANTYATLTEANTYNGNRLFVDSWNVASDPTKDAALLWACRLIDSSFDWTGVAVTATQALAWPRKGMESRNGFLIDDTVIPQQLKDAQSEFARQLIVADRSADNDALKNGIASLRAGPISVNFESIGKNSNTLELRDADVLRAGPEFDFLWKAIPDAVRNLIVPSWYVRTTVSRPLIFSAIR